MIAQSRGVHHHGIIQLSETAQPGHLARHCERDFVVTYAYGFYALAIAATDP